jgi:hypothetical protein
MILAMRASCLTITLFLIQTFLGLVEAAGNQSLPAANFNGSAWFVTVPETWNFSTILDATGRAAIDPDTLPFPYPGFNPKPPPVFVNGTWSGYATNAQNYGFLRALNASIDPYSDETWVLPVVCEWPISTFGVPHVDLQLLIVKRWYVQQTQPNPVLYSPRFCSRRTSSRVAGCRGACICYDLLWSCSRSSLGLSIPKLYAIV